VADAPAVAESKPAKAGTLDGREASREPVGGSRTPVVERSTHGRLPHALAVKGTDVKGGDDVSWTAQQRDVFLGQVQLKDGQPVVLDPWTGAETALAGDTVAGDTVPGTFVQVEVADGDGDAGRIASVVGEPVAAAGSARAQLLEIAARHGLDPTFSPAVLAEVAALVANPGLDDPRLVDMTDKAFITIDNADSRDLDQAMYIEKRADGGYELFYALADASYYVKPGTALFAEATQRATSFYLPGMAIPRRPTGPARRRSCCGRRSTAGRSSPTTACRSFTMCRTRAGRRATRTQARTSPRPWSCCKRSARSA